MIKLWHYIYIGISTFVIEATADTLMPPGFVCCCILHNTMPWNLL